ncbi:NUDIX hydrolase [Candidatus Kaiserbacteria bacterium]|nr:NUDIX hydrolase [Candidatus Kaiserbacteria bacterium]
MELQVGVKVLLKNSDGLFLLIRRSPIKYPESPNRWDIPGGRINPGTTLAENLAREVREETGLVLSGEPRILAAQDILKVEGRHVVRLTYVGHADGVPELSEEHTEYCWVSLDELRVEANVDSFVKKLLEEGIIS